eukprot:6214325-Pleurochrysis_carterae.AAC.1
MRVVVMSIPCVVAHRPSSCCMLHCSCSISTKPQMPEVRTEQYLDLRAVSSLLEDISRDVTITRRHFVDTSAAFSRDLAASSLLALPLRWQPRALDLGDSQIEMRRDELTAVQPTPRQPFSRSPPPADDPKKGREVALRNGEQHRSTGRGRGRQRAEGEAMRANWGSELGNELRKRVGEASWGSELRKRNEEASWGSELGKRIGEVSWGSELG